MDFTTQGGKIYRPRPKAEVCKFSPRGVKSIDDRADRSSMLFSYGILYEKKIVKLKLPYVNITPKIHLHPPRQA